MYRESYTEDCLKTLELKKKENKKSPARVTAGDIDQR